MKILKSDNIVLRPTNQGDIKPMAMYANNKKVWDNLRDYIPFPYNETDAEWFINSLKNEAPQLTFTIEYEGYFSGLVGLVPQKDVYRYSSEIGYWLGEPFWGKGIVSEAVGMITDYGLNELNLVKIYAGIFEFNIGSMRVLEKNGYKKEAILEKSVFKNNQFWNEHRYAILKS
jgi:[ribosomal protein S5]-alanine N-acetyltransferase